MTDVILLSLNRQNNDLKFLSYFLSRTLKEYNIVKPTDKIKIYIVTKEKPYIFVLKLDV